MINESTKRRTTVIERIQLELTRSDVIQKRLSPGKFPTSSVGIVQTISVLLLLSAVIAFFSYKTCPKTSPWHEWLFPAGSSLGAAITIFFYAVFSFGIALQFPAIWFALDICLSIALAILIIVISIITLQDCTESDAGYKIPGPLAISGSVFLLVASAGLYIMYRNKEEISVEEIRPRKSIFSRKQGRADDVEV